MSPVQSAIREETMLTEPPEPAEHVDAHSSGIRSLFISDTHFGHTCSQPARILSFLESVCPAYLYLVGDIIDGWELQRRWKWTPEISRVLDRLAELAQLGCAIRYAIGNHDDFLRSHSLVDGILLRGDVEIADEFEHLTQDGRRFLVVHGDRFDDYSQSSTAVNLAAELGYNALLAGNHWWYRWFGGRLDAMSAGFKQSIPSMTRHVSRFRSLLVDHACSRGYDGIVCGHVHAPEQSYESGVEYCNTGDWLENFSAVTEDTRGEMRVISVAPAEVAFAGTPPGNSDRRRGESCRHGGW